MAECDVLHAADGGVAAIVNVVMYFKLRRISMAESLKSIE